MFQKQVIAIASDHAGFNFKERLLKFLQNRLGNGEVIDLGCGDTQSVDYPDYAEAVCKEILEGRATHGILICGTGVGMCMTANRFKGIRAVLGTDIGVVKLAREHNNANVLCLGGRVGPSEFQVRAMIDLFLEVENHTNNRHLRRLEKMETANERYLASKAASNLDPDGNIQAQPFQQTQQGGKWAHLDDPQSDKD